MAKTKREELDPIYWATISAKGLGELVKKLGFEGKDAGDIGGKEEGYLVAVAFGWFDLGHEGIYYNHFYLGLV
jgi:hypothetical protein